MKITLLILFLAIVQTLHARIGMGEISFATPGGHIICDCDGYEEIKPLLVGYEKKINSMDEWYFYHDHIVGQGKNYYFIFNERTTDLKYFTKKEDWDLQIKQGELKPTYTRWCNIEDSPDAFIYSLILSSYIIIPVILILMFFIVGLSYVKMIVWNKRAWTVASAIFVLVGLMVFYRLNIHSF